MTTIDIEMLPTTAACVACGNATDNLVATLPRTYGQPEIGAFVCDNAACQHGYPMLIRTLHQRGLG